MSGDQTNQKTLTLRDVLAIERTKLANHRTLLAYIRTSMTFFAGAAALIEFFDQNKKLELTAYTSIALGVIFLSIGVYNYHSSKKAVKAMGVKKKEKG
jgi:putative membrane protein